MAWWDCEVFELLVSRLHKRLRKKNAKKTPFLGLFWGIGNVPANRSEARSRPSWQ